MELANSQLSQQKNKESGGGGDLNYKICNMSDKGESTEQERLLRQLQIRVWDSKPKGKK